MRPPLHPGDAGSTPGFGEPFPFLEAETDGVARYALQTAAGRWLVVLAFGTLAHPPSAAAHEAVTRAAKLFDDVDAAFFGVSVDRADRDGRGLSNAVTGRRYLWDFDRCVCSALGLVEDGGLRPTVFLLDRGYRVVMAEPVEATPAVLERLRRELEAERGREAPFAPVLTIERVLEPELCERLMAYFAREGGTPSGFMVEEAGVTVSRLDPRFKRRADVDVADPGLQSALRERLQRRLFPAIRRAFNWSATEIERLIVARYAAEDGGFFAAHRDDTTPGTAHRRFAVTLNLNAEAYAGGELRFPEFGPRAYRRGSGAARRSAARGPPHERRDALRRRPRGRP